MLLPMALAEKKSEQRLHYNSNIHRPHPPPTNPHPSIDAPCPVHSATTHTAPTMSTHPNHSPAASARREGARCLGFFRHDARTAAAAVLLLS